MIQRTDCNKVLSTTDTIRLKVSTTKHYSSTPDALLVHAGRLSVPVAVKWMLGALIYEVAKA